MSKMMKVIDSSVTSEYSVRRHDIFVNGKLQTVEFKHGEEMILPYEAAMKFMVDGFTVVDLDTNSALSVPPDQVNRNANIVLNENEVIATYDELTLKSLKVRAVLKRDGETMLDASREEIIEFLKNSAAQVIDDEEILIEDDADQETVTVAPAQIDPVSEPVVQPEGEQEAATVAPAAPEDVVALFGSSVLPSEFLTDSGVVTLGDIVLRAFEQSGLATAAEWNSFVSENQEDAERLMQAEVDKLILVKATTEESSAVQKKSKKGA